MDFLSNGNRRFNWKPPKIFAEGDSASFNTREIGVIFSSTRF